MSKCILLLLRQIMHVRHPRFIASK
jgi:hypothetical protein